MPRPSLLCTLALLIALPGAAVAAPLPIDNDGAVTLELYPGYQGGLVRGTSPAPAWGQPLIRHVHVAAPDVLVLTVDARGVEHRPLEPYVPQPTDTIRLHTMGETIRQELWDVAFLDKIAPPEARAAGEMNLWVFVDRAGEPLGWRVGPERNWLWREQPMRGDFLDRNWADKAAHYRLSSPDDPAYRTARQPSGVVRKSKLHHKGAKGPGYGGPQGEQHQIHLRLPAKLTPGRTYTLSFDAGSPFASPVSFTFDDRLLRTEAIHVNQAGFHPRQVKRAWVSTWMGKDQGVSYDWMRDFLLVRDIDAETVFTGSVRRRKAADMPELTSEARGPEDHVRTAVYELDFTEFREPGRYRIVLPGVGASFPFAIDEAVWTEAAKLQLIGFLNQRSGIQLGPPYTDYIRPRNFHPADPHVRVHELDRAKFFAYQPPAGQRDDNPFYRIRVSLLRGTNNPEAWGSWADAADHDRRFGHLQVVHTMLDLYSANPGYFRALRASLPERANGLPGIVNEALWGIGLYRRTQRESGEIIYGVESWRHPNRGEPSWLDTLPLAVIPGTPASAFSYAGAAAHMAYVLRDLDASGSEDFEASARRAFRWAMQERENPMYPSRHRTGRGGIVLAALHLYRLTGEPSFHEIFRRSFHEHYGPTESIRQGLMQQRWLDQKELCLYALLPERLADPALQKACREAVMAAADRLLAGAAESAFPLLRPQNKPYIGWVVQSEGSLLVITAHRLTGAARYLDALVDACQYAMGANPLNLSYTTGLGTRFAYPMIGDAEFAGLGWPGGITTYGPSLFDAKALPETAWSWDQARRKAYASQLTPADICDWPGHELYFRQIGFPAINEFTVQQTMNDTLLRWGYLAQHFASSNEPVPGASLLIRSGAAGEKRLFP